MSYRTLVLAMCGCVALGASGCVTERVVRPSPTSPVAGTGAAAPGGTSIAGSGTAATAAARPVPSLASARVMFALSPLTEVPYDGQTLPLISTGVDGGRFVATQIGPPAPWGAVLGEPGRTAGLSRVAAYDLSARPPGPAAWSQAVVAGTLPALDPGYLLGRGGDETGFLIEVPRPDGSRWLARVAWETGAVTWLVRDSAANAHGLLLRSGELVFSRAVPGGEAGRAAPSDLVLRRADGTLVTLLPAPGGVGGAGAGGGKAARPSYHLPLLSPDQQHLVVWAVWPPTVTDAAGTAGAATPARPGALQLVWLARREDGNWAPVGAPLAMGAGTIADAYQAVAPVEAAPAATPAAVVAASGDSGGEVGRGLEAIARGVVYLSPLTGELVWQVSPTQVAGGLGVQAGGAARVATAAGAGWALSTREGLVFAPLAVMASEPSTAEGGGGPAVGSGTLSWSLLSTTQLQRGPAIAKQTGRADGRLISIVPGAAAARPGGGGGGGATLRLWAVTIAPIQADAAGPAMPGGSPRQ